MNFDFTKLVPYGPTIGPPIPRVFNITWPWYKPEPGEQEYVLPTPGGIVEKVQNVPFVEDFPTIISQPITPVEPSPGNIVVIPEEEDEPGAVVPPVPTPSVPSTFDPWIYDVDGDGYISLSESLRAVNDWKFDKITEAQRDVVIKLWKGLVKRAEYTPSPTSTSPTATKPASYLPSGYDYVPEGIPRDPQNASGYIEIWPTPPSIGWAQAHGSSVVEPPGGGVLVRTTTTDPSGNSISLWKRATVWIFNRNTNQWDNYTGGINKAYWDQWFIDHPAPPVDPNAEGESGWSW